MIFLQKLYTNAVTLIHLVRPLLCSGCQTDFVHFDLNNPFATGAAFRRARQSRSPFAVVPLTDRETGRQTDGRTVLCILIAFHCGHVLLIPQFEGLYLTFLSTIYVTYLITPTSFFLLVLFMSIEVLNHPTLDYF
jgi:hypothetical protein